MSMQLFLFQMLQVVFIENILLVLSMLVHMYTCMCRYVDVCHKGRAFFGKFAKHNTVPMTLLTVTGCSVSILLSIWGSNFTGNIVPKVKNTFIAYEEMVRILLITNHFFKI